MIISQKRDFVKWAGKRRNNSNGCVQFRLEAFATSARRLHRRATKQHRINPASPEGRNDCMVCYDNAPRRMCDPAHSSRSTRRIAYPAVRKRKQPTIQRLTPPCTSPEGALFLAGGLHPPSLAAGAKRPAHEWVNLAFQTTKVGVLSQRSRQRSSVLQPWPLDLPPPRPSPASRFTPLQGREPLVCICEHSSAPQSETPRKRLASGAFCHSGCR